MGQLRIAAAPGVLPAAAFGRLVRQALAGWSTGHSKKVSMSTLHSRRDAWRLFAMGQAAAAMLGLTVYILSGADTPTRRSAVAMTVRTAPISARRAWV
ncbi:hypothetical protein ABEW19_30355 [Paenibacillus illinoisensis]|uniref:hypothetical protein n=1 Tax=Paenibacillus illinoisensis TaxID=59845 RepID=UPI003D2755D4